MSDGKLKKIFLKWRRINSFHEICSYVHSMGCVTVKLNEDRGARNLSQILMWSWCSKCQEMTPNVAMQKDTWCLSFGKYLEMRFHNHAYRRRCLDTKEAEQCDADGGNNAVCTHSLHRDYVQNFSFNGIVATFSYTPIDVWEINLPSLIVTVETTQMAEPASYIEEVKAFSSRGYEVYATIYDKLAQMSSDMEIPMLGNLKRMLNAEQLIFREKIGMVQTLLTEKLVNKYDINDAMQLAKRTLADNIEMWGQRLTEASNQSRAIHATGNKPELAINTQLQPQTQSQIDAGTICTEDLRSDSDSPNTCNADTHEPFYNREVSTDSDNSNQKVSVPDATPNVTVEKEQKTPSQRSVKTILRDLLPSEKNVQHVLQSPIPSNEHCQLPAGHIPVLVNDHDISSVIAYSLASYEYKKILENLNYPDIPRKSYDSSTDLDDREPSTVNHKEAEKDKKAKSYIEIHFQDSTAQFSCRIYFARDFDLMRSKFLRFSESTDGDVLNAGRRHTDSESEARLGKDFDRKSSSASLNLYAESPKCESDADAIQKKETERVRMAFARSLSKSVRWEARGGKSGSKFCKTLGKHFLLIL